MDIYRDMTAVWLVQQDPVHPTRGPEVSSDLFFYQICACVR